jgi:hypothetical protein
VQAFTARYLVDACEAETCEVELENRKTVAYVLLVVGVVLIFFAVFEMIFVFTGVNSPPKLFGFLDISANGSLLISGQDMNKIAGISFWFVLMAFIMLAGGKIAHL